MVAHLGVHSLSHSATNKPGNDPRLDKHVKFSAKHPAKGGKADFFRMTFYAMCMRKFMASMRGKVPVK